MDIARWRLVNHRLVGSDLKTPAGVVAHMGGIQAQDYDGGIWSIGLRLPGSTEADVHTAIAARTVIRTWAMRGTLHFIEAGSIRWILELLANGIIARASLRHRQLGLDSVTFRRSEDVLTKALEGGKQMTREELVGVLESRGIRCDGQRAVYILHWASVNRVICFGVKRGKQFTHVLFEEWVGKTRPLSSDQALGELTCRFFTSHAPATVQDFMWWSGLSAADAAKGIEISKKRLEKQEHHGRTYWAGVERRPAGTTVESIQLLPGFDDYLLGYKNRGASLDPKHAHRLGSGGVLRPSIIMNGEVIGTWRRTKRQNRPTVMTETFVALGKKGRSLLDAAVNAYNRFIGPDQ